jgi:hypothetical protein
MVTEKIFQQAKDKNVAAVVIYEKTSETKAYKDAAYTTQFTTSELKDAFLKGAVIALAAGGFATPVGYSETSSVGSVDYVSNGESISIVSLAAVADPA